MKESILFKSSIYSSIEENMSIFLLNESSNCFFILNVEKPQIAISKSLDATITQSLELENQTMSFETTPI
ncbi:hypothetical protein CMT89_18685 [Elizabethkingia anophelis]|nr:hypothetical protein [Elizabethkingia anophelis]MDV3477430.1 hypothetical protein [Elizabethkingia anophelis]MDV3859179.1 hypothetical protein [Elizabethkingia anophelis]MDV3903208.1 hypothetical protein [Elizabethkingia anophelis]MDV3994911.1 hypothetical protein [Elizabethkingia anophelis]